MDKEKTIFPRLSELADRSFNNNQFTFTNFLSIAELSEYYENLLTKYPIISIEDPFDENDESGRDDRQERRDKQREVLERLVMVLRDFDIVPGEDRVRGDLDRDGLGFRTAPHANLVPITRDRVRTGGGNIVQRVPRGVVLELAQTRDGAAYIDVLLEQVEFDLGVFIDRGLRHVGKLNPARTLARLANGNGLVAKVLGTLDIGKIIVLLQRAPLLEGHARAHMREDEHDIVAHLYERDENPVALFKHHVGIEVPGLRKLVEIDMNGVLAANDLDTLRTRVREHSARLPYKVAEPRLGIHRMLADMLHGPHDSHAETLERRKLARRKRVPTLILLAQGLDKPAVIVDVLAAFHGRTPFLDLRQLLKHRHDLGILDPVAEAALDKRREVSAASGAKGNGVNNADSAVKVLYAHEEQMVTDREEPAKKYNIALLGGTYAKDIPAKKIGQDFNFDFEIINRSSFALSIRNAREYFEKYVAGLNSDGIIIQLGKEDRELFKANPSNFDTIYLEFIAAIKECNSKCRLALVSINNTMKDSTIAAMNNHISAIAQAEQAVFVNLENASLWNPKSVQSSLDFAGAMGLSVKKPIYDVAQVLYSYAAKNIAEEEMNPRAAV